MTESVDTDPFPEILPALLNSADIQAYQAACGLISGEVFDPDRLKAASYKILCRGEVYYCDDDNRRARRTIAGQEVYELPRNGLAFIVPDVTFNLPDFIAARFNLTINLVHQGLLLGTGPLIDPGFKGALVIPLHNLTDSTVKLTATDGLIWVEFTKLSGFDKRKYNGVEYEFRKSFQDSKILRSTDQYFSITGGVPVRSTLHDHTKQWSRAIEEVRKLQDLATEQEARLRKLLAAGFFLGTVAIVGLFAAVWQTYASAIAVVQQAQQSVEGANKQLGESVEKNRAAICELADRISLISFGVARDLKGNPTPIRPSVKFMDCPEKR